MLFLQPVILSFAQERIVSQEDGWKDPDEWNGREDERTVLNAIHEMYQGWK